MSKTAGRLVIAEFSSGKVTGPSGAAGEVVESGDGTASVKVIVAGMVAVAAGVDRAVSVGITGGAGVDAGGIGFDLMT